jgi:hypothetical protein
MDAPHGSVIAHHRSPGLASRKINSHRGFRQHWHHTRTGTYSAPNVSLRTKLIERVDNRCSRYPKVRREGSRGWKAGAGTQAAREDAIANLFEQLFE